MFSRPLSRHFRPLVSTALTLSILFAGCADDDGGAEPPPGRDQPDTSLSSPAPAAAPGEAGPAAPPMPGTPGTGAGQPYPGLNPGQTYGGTTAPLEPSPAETPGATPPAEDGSEADAEDGLSAIMIAIGKGPDALTPTLGKELKSDPPAWDSIREHADTYLGHVRKMADFDPPKGEKEAWLEATTAFAENAIDLDEAAKAEDLEAAKNAHDALTNSCMACHKVHRVMPAPGGRGGPGGGGRRPGGGPGGPPPGGTR